MRERKQIIDDYSDVFLAMPGGIGTLEELAEVMTLRQLGFHDRPILVLDPADFWAPLRQQFRNMITGSLASPDILALVEFYPDVTSVLAALVQVAKERCGRV